MLGLKLIHVIERRPQQNCQNRLVPEEDAIYMMLKCSRQYQTFVITESASRVDLWRFLLISSWTRWWIKHPNCWWFETQWRSCDVSLLIYILFTKFNIRRLSLTLISAWMSDHIPSKYDWFQSYTHRYVDTTTRWYWKKRFSRCECWLGDCWETWSKNATKYEKIYGKCL